jgi:hypothetical protein
VVVGQIGVYVDGTKAEGEHDPGNRDYPTVAASEAVQSPKLGHSFIVNENWTAPREWNNPPWAALMDQEGHHHDRFTPRRPASRFKLILAFVLGPIAWVVALTVAAWLVSKTDTIEIGLLIAIASFVVGFVVLALLRWARAREERRFVARAR